MKQCCIFRIILAALFTQIRMLHNLHRYINRRSLSAMALMIIYFIAFWGVQLQHTDQHSQEQAHLHDAIHESNLCHQSIYHQDLGSGCSHTTHFIDLSDECDLCVALLRTNILVQKISNLPDKITQNHNLSIHITPWLLVSSERTVALRGPPTYV
jgi:hypothetical protein